MKKGLMFILLVLSFVGMNDLAVNAKSKTKSLTFYENGQLSYYDLDIKGITKVKSSNKKVAVVYKSDDEYFIKAKKKGKAKITVKGKKKTYTYNVTVKETPVFDVAIEGTINDGYNSYAVVRVTSPIGVDNIDTFATFNDSEGKPVFTSSAHFDFVGAGQTAYAEIYCGTNLDKIDFTKTTFETKFSRQSDVNYEDVTSKVDYQSEIVGDRIRITLSGIDCCACYSIIYKDSDGNITGIDDIHAFLHGEMTAFKELPKNTISAEIISKRALRFQ